MTQAPTPGPLSGGDMKLLVKLLDTLKPFAEVAEKLKHCHVVEICEPTPENPSRNIIPMPREWFERAGDDLEYIAIQLHASGVLSEGQASKITGLDRVSVRREVDRLAPTAPVEASGSERLSDAIRFMEDAAVMLGRGEMPAPGMKYANRWRDAHMVLLEALRPHPSGETRELVAYLKTYRPHVADGGAVTVYVPLTLQQIDAVLAALSTTPARAEAQDEGAAGEPVEPYAWIWRDMTKLRLDFTRDPSVVAIKREQGCEIQPLYAHPSPTLAADADRVRIAVEALEYYAGPHAMPNEGPWGASSDDYGRRAAEAIRALKLGGGK